MKLIRAYFDNGRSFVYTTAILPLLKTDPHIAYIVDEETGEVIFDKEGGYNNV
jgi:hypothetical protein